MFTCLWQLWDWLDPPPLFTTATMESKKLQQLQQGNTHMASQPMPQTKAPSYHTTTDYRPQHSPVFQNHPQYQSLSSNFAQINMTSHQQPHLHVKPIGPGAQYGGTGFTQPQTPSQHLNHYHGEQLYQNNTRERLYHQAPLRQHYASSHQHINPSTQLQQQYQQLQQAKLQAQLQTQSDALIQQQRTFALRQQLNPPVPHYHLQSQTSLNQIPVQVQPQSQAQSMHRSAPPSSLNLTNQYQPDRTGKLPPDSHYGTTQAPANQLSPQSGNDDWLLMQSKESVPMPADYFTGLTNAALLQNHKAQSQAIYQQNQLIQQQMIQNKLQQQKSPQDQIIIQQNNPGSVMNQACQTQISGQVPKAKQQQQQNVEKTPSPSHAPLDRKKSGGTPIALKSPVTKRPASSPVTLSGWLYKQGSDGLKVWRKRWFVLSDYCLFYYKGPEEEKLLGSILLPSYRVGACSPEDKIYRKYAFKCEHVNMRTYWLAAETAESMGQWVRALTAATMMQCSSESDQTPQPSMSSSQNPSGENSDSGIHTYQSQQSKIGIPGTGHGPLTPASDGIGGGSSAGGSATGGGPQPLYANAPPKPKRANDGGYSSPSPEHSVERYDGGFDGQHLDANQRRLDVKSPLSHQSPDSLYEVRRQMAKSPDPALASRMQQIRLEGTKSPNAAQQQVRSPYPSENAYGQELGQNLFMRQHVHPSENVEDVYGGRENIIRAPHRFDDYAGRQLYGELNEREMQLRMAQQKYHQSGAIPGQQALYPNNERRTPDTYGRSRSGQDRRNFADYEDIYNLQQQAMGDLGSYRRPMSPIGYQNNKSTPGRYTPNYLEPNTAAQHVQMRARPVQSTLIPRPHSADFLEYEARSAEAAQMQAEPARAPRPKSSLDINRAPDSYYYSEASYAEKLRQSALYQTKPSTMPLRYSGNPFAADMANTIPRESDYNQRAYRQQQQQQLQKGFISQQQEQFLRSASARLPRKEEEANGRDCERRREESMKRLLEWKQRMLQSPLTRKGATLSATSTMNQSKSPIPMNSGLQRSRSETHTNAGYNSYSSDDEDVSAGDQLWEEDTLWRESLRRVSHRHARSLDDLDRICHAKRLIQDTKSRGQLTRDVTYVNDNVAASTQSRSSLRKKVYRKKASDRKGSSKQAIAAVAPADCDENDVYVQLAVDEQSGDVYETLREDRGAFLQQRPSDADREKIRQWDAMSSGAAGGVLGTLNDTKGIRGQLSSGSDATDAQASLSVQNVKNVQSPGLSVKPNDAIDIQRGGHMSNNHEDRYPVNMVRGYEQQQGWHMKKSTSQRGIDQLERENAMRSLDMSAGDLLSRTHEELVLLLIQLRRQNSATARAIEQCCTDIHDVQNRIRTSDGQTKMDNINRLDALKQQLVDLEKQYEKSKPLVNLVDNMVKLGSLYRGPTNVNRHVGNESVTLDRLEFNQRVQERRLLQEERRHWDRLSPNHTELQSKVQQLYQLDQLLQEESGTLQSLQRDKEDLERALGGLRSRMQNGVGPPIAIEAARKQQHALERELSRVHQLLAENSKVDQKLEQTVAGNARLEQELLVLRQKLQASRDSRGSQTALSAGSGSNAGAPDSITYAGGATAVLESDILELRRVQQLVGDMQRQRQELSQAVRQLTENSNSLYQQIRPSDHQSNSKKRPQNSSWMETDLDSMISSDHSSNQTAHIEHVSTNPFLNQSLYIDTNSMHGQKTHENDIKASKNFNNHHELSDGVESSMDSDDLLEGNQLNGLSVQDKQEIKTVRIVKRESERRQRDRERTNSSSQNLDQVLEEENHLQEDYLNYARSKSLPRGYTDQGYDPFKGGESLKSPRVTSKGNTIYAPGPTIPGTSGKYSDYYNHAQMTNHYPVSMTERTEDPAKYYSQMTDKNYKATYGSTGELAGLKAKTESIQSLTKSIGELSPVFQSEAARQIIYEMSGSTSEENGEKVPLASKHRRAVPKEKRRHNTAPSNVIVKTMQQIQSENDMNRNNTNWRARDDLDMEVALRPRSNAPDVVRSALGPREKISENTIDKLLAAPSKILIPERYIPEQPPELSPEEKKRRQEKVEAIKKMLSEAPLNPSNDNVSAPPSQISAEKKQREHLLQLNQILAQQVMQMSKIVAEKAMATLPSKVAELTKNIPDDDQPSPTEPLPLYQQRDNYFT
ncbi:uncharacterized protein LOC129787495 isoform X15 [Lutzomyia longipalpis]|uniref:uncharacterized protein LOC129787495 isoform X15 n=1 Tax=Lutzomyia longipalpis TaxID=7200 RepID=UPI002483DD85|nr:uncharacterized protein LOC129787495 isoform X15 [Lutzomyia longipalpis]